MSHHPPRRKKKYLALKKKKLRGEIWEKNLMNPLKRISRAQHHSGTAQSPFCAAAPHRSRTAGVTEATLNLL